jgi:hypothetical protein
MTNQKLLFAAAASLTSLVVVGCFGGDPNKNSMLLPGMTGGAGSTGSGGSSGTGTGGSSGLGAIPGTPIATFDSTIEGFVFSTDTSSTNLHITQPDTTTLTLDSSNGSPTPGSLQVAAPYSGASQIVDIQKSFGQSAAQDWSHRTLHVRIKVTTGTFGGGAQVYVVTGAGYVFGGTYTNVQRGSNWVDYSTNLDSPMTKDSGYDPTKVVVVGVQMNSGTAGASATPVTFNIDSFSVDPPLPMPDAGGGTGGSGGAAGSGGGGSGGASGNDAATD